MARPESVDPHQQYQEAATALGLTDRKHEQLRDDFEKAAIALERNLCDDSLRQVAGQTAVEYYETLLEKPLAKAGLGMTQRGVCGVKDKGGKVSVTEALSLVYSFRNGLRLPWDCMPAHWRTPSDLALQAKLEADIREGHLTADALTGTLGLLAKPWELSKLASLCKPQPGYTQNSYAKPLPLLSPPPDSWSGRRR